MRKHRARERAGTRRGSWLAVVGILSLTLVVGLALPGKVVGQAARPRVEEGNRLYSEGRFDEAHQKYLEALLDDPESPLIRFNDGNALYQKQEFPQAMERFREALEGVDPALRSSAWYNLGNALYRQQQLQQSLEAYKEALRSNPGDVDAKHNLERVLEQLEQHEQQPQQGDQGDQNEASQGNQGQDDRQGQSPQGQPPPASGDENPPQDEANPQQRPEANEPSPGEGEAQEQPQPVPGQMTPEEAERLLNAIREDPGEVNRKRVPSTGKRPRKDW